MGVDWQRSGSGLFGGGISETWGMVVAEDRVLGGCLVNACRLA